MSAQDPVEAEKLAELLAATSLANRPVVDAGGRGLAVECHADEVWDAWSAARAVVDRSGRWPVVVTTFTDGTQPWAESLIADDSYATDVVTAADTADPWATFVHHSAGVSMDEWSMRWIIQDDPHLTDKDAGDLLAAGATMFDVERLKLDRRLTATGSSGELVADPSLTSREGLWFVPTGQRCAVVFLPVATSWEATARVYYFGADSIERHAALVAAAKRWEMLYGAELVASWTTMLQFVATTPPASVDDAWELAGQQLAAGGSLQTDRSDLTVALMHADAWFLHDRP